MTNFVIGKEDTGNHQKSDTMSQNNKANEAKGFGHVANHNSCFDIDEDALVYGTEFLMKSAFELMK